jgi:hypothetical protein
MHGGSGAALLYKSLASNKLVIFRVLLTVTKMFVVVLCLTHVRRLKDLLHICIGIYLLYYLISSTLINFFGITKSVKNIFMTISRNVPPFSKCIVGGKKAF